MKARTERRWRTGLSIAAAGVLVLGVASCFRGAYFSRTSPAGTTFGISVARGALFVVNMDNLGAAIPPKEGTRFSMEPVEGSPRLVLGPAAPFAFSPSGDPLFQIRLPLWIPLLVLAAPAAWLWRKHLRQPPGLCASCGYDVRGVRGTQCPECGHLVQASDGSEPA